MDVGRWLQPSAQALLSVQHKGLPEWGRCDERRRAANPESPHVDVKWWSLALTRLYSVRSIPCSEADFPGFQDGVQSAARLGDERSESKARLECPKFQVGLLASSLNFDQTSKSVRPPCLSIYYGKVAEGLLHFCRWFALVVPKTELLGFSYVCGSLVMCFRNQSLGDALSNS